MKENKLSFESENLQVDYLTFNIESKEPERLQKIVDYFSKNFQCNSFLIDVQNSTKSGSSASFSPPNLRSSGTSTNSDGKVI